MIKRIHIRYLFICLFISCTGCSNAQACGIPSPFFVYDKDIWEVVIQPDNDEGSFLDKRYGKGHWQYKKKVIALRETNTNPQTADLFLAIYPNTCPAEKCDRIELFGIINVTYYRDGQKRRSGPKMLPLLSMERWASKPTRFTIPGENLQDIEGIVAVIRVSKDPEHWVVQRLDFTRRFRCGWHEFAESIAMASFYDYCYSYAHGGFSSDPWPKSDIKSAICHDTGIIERNLPGDPK